MHRVLLLLSLLLVPLEAAARTSRRTGGWVTLVVLGGMFAVMLGNKLLPAKIKSSPMLIPAAVGAVLGIFISQAVAAIAANSGWVTQGQFLPLAVTIYVLIVLGAAAFGHFRGKRPPSSDD